MNLQKLFEAQKELDDHIRKEKGLEGQDLLDKKILALQVELGELANEHRGFKFWSGRQEPVTNDLRVADYKESGEAILETYNPLLEEYVDCLHFILSIGLEIRIDEVFDELELGHSKENNIIELFMSLNYDISSLYYQRENDAMSSYHYGAILDDFIRMGELLGFTWEQIEQSYYEKNRINHERQENGY